MIKNENDVSLITAGKIVGIGFLISVLGPVIATICGTSLGISEGEASLTAQKIIESNGLFRIGIIGWFIAIIGDVIRAWAFYVIFKNVNKSIALLSAWWMLLHDAIFGFANTCLVMVSEILSGSGYFGIMQSSEIHPFMMMLLKTQNIGFEIGLFFFSFHLLLLGYLSFKSGFVPKLVGFLVLIAGLGYLLDSTGQLFFHNYPKLMTSIISLPNIIGELTISVWLTFWGGKAAEKYYQLSIEKR